MTLDASLPEDDVKISELPSYMRETRAAVATGVIEISAVTLAAIDTEITSGDSTLEIIRLSATAAASPNAIGSAPTNGQIKVIIALDNNITLIHNTGNMELKGNPAAMDFPMQAGDIIAFIYDSIQASWVEMFRAIMP